MITVIAEHSVDLSLLPKQGTVMDAGCRGFLFTDEMRRLGHVVYAIDIDTLWPRQHFLCAIAGYTGKCSIQKSPDPQATRMTEGFDIPCYTIKDFSEMTKVDFWDLIKIDIEGSEYEVIMSLTEPPAKQLSIEFHLHTGVYGIQDVRKMEAKLHSLGYEFASHQMTSQHGMGMNYWDSLFILK
jgi:hypothetical protein